MVLVEVIIFLFYSADAHKGDAAYVKQQKANKLFISA